MNLKFQICSKVLRALTYFIQQKQLDSPLIIVSFIAERSSPVTSEELGIISLSYKIIKWNKIERGWQLAVEEICANKCVTFAYKRYLVCNREMTVSRSITFIQLATRFISIKENSISMWSQISLLKSLSCNQIFNNEKATIKLIFNNLQTNKQYDIILAYHFSEQNSWTQITIFVINIELPIANENLTIIFIRRQPVYLFP